MGEVPLQDMDRLRDRRAHGMDKPAVFCQRGGIGIASLAPATLVGVQRGWQTVIALLIGPHLGRLPDVGALELLCRVMVGTWALGLRRGAPGADVCRLDPDTCMNIAAQISPAPYMVGCILSNERVAVERGPNDVEGRVRPPHGCRMVRSKLNLFLQCRLRSPRTEGRHRSGDDKSHVLHL